jgi:hypothetical protein
MGEGDATIIAVYERQAKRMDALAAKAHGSDMREAFRRVAVEFRALAQDFGTVRHRTRSASQATPYSLCRRRKCLPP